MDDFRHPFAPPPVEQHDVPWRDFQQTTKFAVMLGLAAACWYLTFIYDRAHENHPVLWWFTLLAESLVVLHTVGIWSTLAGYRSDIPEAQELGAIRRSLLTGEIDCPAIDVYVCCAGEPDHVVLRTVIAAQEMLLPHNTWILDDGRNDRLRDAAERLGVGYLRRSTDAHAKAGNVNAAFQRTDGRFVAILDADHVPRPDFLAQTVPHLIANPSVGMVQTPQTYDPTDRGMIAEGAAVSQELFYTAIMPAKNASNSAFCVGTNVVFRRSALASLTTEPGASTETTRLGREYPAGGIWVGSNSEDVWTSLELIRRGWRTVFVPKVLTRGLTPDRLRPFLAQQFRWACGGWEMLFRARVLSEHRLTLSQKVQYLMVPSHYALSIATAIFLFMSPVYLLVDQSPIQAGFWDWLAHYAPFYLLTIAVPFLQAGKVRPSAIVMSLAAVPAHLRALLMTITRQQAPWTPTHGQHRGFSLRDVVPHLAIGVFSIAALVVGLSLPSRNVASTSLAVFFVGLQLTLIVALLIGSERADRLADRHEADEPDDDETASLLESYLANHRIEGIERVDAH